MTTEKSIEKNNFTINFIFFVLTIFLLIIIPKILKLNRISFIIGFIIPILLVNFLVFFYKIYNDDNSWYTEKIEFNNSEIYKKAVNDILRYMKEGVKNGFGYIFRPINNYIFKPIGNGINYILQKKEK